MEHIARNRLRQSASRLWLLVALLLVLPGLYGQQAEPYFSLHSNETYLSGEQPTVQLWGNVPSLEFRVYRVNDPLAFFRKLENVSSFGEASARPQRDRTWLEQFHAWKRHWRFELRDATRAQFSSDSRRRIRLALAKQDQQKTAATEYAVVPVLNQQQLVSTWRQSVPQSQRPWESVQVPVQVPGKGLYLVEAVHNQLRAYTIVFVTDLAVITKAGPGRLIAYVVDRRTGEPEAGVPVRFWLEREEKGREETSRDGLVDLRINAERPEEALALIQRGDDFAVSQVYSWNLTSSPHQDWKGYIYTDRPVYRPGHMVHAKGILRFRDGKDYKLPPDERYDAEIQDGTGKTVWRGAVRTTPFGTVSLNYELPPDAALGYYNVQVKTGEVTMDGGFHVEEYRKPEYKVQVDVGQSFILQQQSFDVTIQARYYYGEPVANASVTWVVHRARYWPYMFSEYRDEFDEDSPDNAYMGWEQISETQGTLDSEGRLTVKVPTTITGWDARYRIEARVMDASNREISGAGFGIATYGSFALGLGTDKYFYSSGETAVVEVKAATYDRSPVATPFRVQLEEWSWNDRSGRVISTIPGTTGPDGSGEARGRLPGAGSFRLLALARTPEGREVTTERYLWVGGSGGWGEAQRSIRIVPDKSSYAPGDVAKLLVITGLESSNTLLTIEGRTLDKPRVIRAQGPTTVVEVPIDDTGIPDFFVSATLIRDNAFYSAAKRIKVPAAEKQLSVTIESSKEQYVPGEKAVYRVTAKDHAGRPVRAELSLGLVDEAIYAVRPDTVEDPVRYFYSPGYNQIGTTSSLTYYFRGEAGKRAMPLARVRPSGYRAQLKPQLVEPKVRKAFPDTVFWVAHLTTNDQGVAVVETQFPDSLTTFRATARAITPDTRLGSATQKVLVRKNLILTMATPRFFTAGDEVTLSAIVRNYLESEKKAKVSLQARGLELISGGETDVAVPPRGEAKVDFRFRALASAREAVVLGKALTNEESDAVELNFPIRPFGVLLSSGQAGVSAAGAASTAQIRFPDDAQPASRELELRLTPSVAGAVFGGLDYLTSFPYGCTEQTMSSFLPNLLVSRAMPELGLETRDSASLPKKIQAGIDRLMQLRHGDGGWGWWSSDESDLFMTAYVLAGFGLAREAGQEVPEHILHQAADWLRQHAGGADNPDQAAWAAYAIGFVGGENQAQEQAWQNRSKLTPLGLALLGLTMQREGAQSQAGELARLLKGKVTQEGPFAFWKADRDSLMEFEADTSAEATAYAVKFLGALDSSDALLPRAAGWLAAHRDQGFYWSSTKQTALVILGLTDYLKQTGELDANFRATVRLNGKTLATRSFGRTEALSPQPVVLRVPVSDLAGENRVELQVEGSGRLYWSTDARYVTIQPREVGRGSYKLNVLRQYFRLQPARDGERIVYDLVPLEGTLHPGDVVAVRLTVSGSPWRYLMVEDPIPAGAEFIQRDDLYTLRQRPPWWDFAFSHKEFRDDRAALFDRVFTGGQDQFVYLLKVVNPGRYQVSPAIVQPMYQPEMRASTPGLQVVVE